MILFYCFCKLKNLACCDITRDVDMTSFLPKLYDGKQNIALLGGVSY